MWSICRTIVLEPNQTEWSICQTETFVFFKAFDQTEAFDFIEAFVFIEAFEFDCTIRPVLDWQTIKNSEY